MLCSRCSSAIKPVVAIDIDGTLGDYHLHFMNFAMNYLGVSRDRRISVFVGEGTYLDWFCRTFKVDATTFRRVKTAYRAGGMKRMMPVWEGAPYLMSRLSATGAEIWLTTTRPYMKFDGIDDDTRFWLAQNRMATYDHLLYDEDKYARLAERVDPARVVAVLDDEIEQVNRAQDVFGTDVPILRTVMANAQARRRPGTLWASDLGVAGDIIIKRIEKWQPPEA